VRLARRGPRRDRLVPAAPTALRERPQEYEERVVGFFDDALLDVTP
jgi:hypothetical protein